MMKRLFFPLLSIVPEIYGEIVTDPIAVLRTTGAQRTGCSMCGFGIHLEQRPHRFDKLRERNPKEWEFWMYRCCTDPKTGEKYGWGRVLDYIGVEWENPPEVQMTIFDFPEYLPETKELDIMRDIRAMTGIQMNVELGLQTANYHTLQMIDRGHGLAEFIDAVLRIKSYTAISICTHVILNLPGDTAADAKETARILTALGVDIVKLHSLYIARNTRLCDWYENGKITVCSKEEYFERVITFLEQIPETVAVERMFSRIPEKDAVFCNWGCSWWRLRDELLQKMEEEGRYQGRCCDYLNGAALRLLKSE